MKSKNMNRTMAGAGISVLAVAGLWQAALAGMAPTPATPYNNCLLLLESEKDQALKMEGKSTLVVNTVMANSRDEHAVRVEDNAQIKSANMYLRGGMEVKKHAVVSGATTTMDSSASDPYAARALPSAASMPDKGKFDKHGHGNDKKKDEEYTISPGYYSGGIEAKENCTVTMQPGVYIVGGHGMHIHKATLIGDGVTIIMAEGSLRFHDAAIMLEPMTSGPTSGMTIAQPMSNDKKMDIKGSSTVAVLGTIWAPNAKAKFEGKPNKDKTQYELNAEGKHEKLKKSKRREPILAGEMVVLKSLKVKGPVRIGGPEAPDDEYAPLPGPPPMND